MVIVIIVLTANGATVGRTETSGTSSSTKLRSAQRVLMTEGGTITSISIYHGGTGAQVMVGIYSDNAGSPGNLLVRSGIMGVENAGWQTIYLPQSVYISANTYVWLAWFFMNYITLSR